MIELLRRIFAMREPDILKEHRAAAERLNEESRKLEEQIEDCTWDELADGLIGPRPRKRNGNGRDT